MLLSYEQTFQQSGDMPISVCRLACLARHNVLGKCQDCAGSDVERITPVVPLTSPCMGSGAPFGRGSLTYSGRVPSQELVEDSPSLHAPTLRDWAVKQK